MRWWPPTWSTWSLSDPHLGTRALALVSVTELPNCTFGGSVIATLCVDTMKGTHVNRLTRYSIIGGAALALGLGALGFAASQSPKHPGATTIVGHAAAHIAPPMTRCQGKVLVPGGVEHYIARWGTELRCDMVRPMQLDWLGGLNGDVSAAECDQMGGTFLLNIGGTDSPVDPNMCLDADY